MCCIRPCVDTAVCIGFSAYITGVFGMNLDNTTTIQQQKGLFAAIVGATFFFIVVGIGMVIGYYRSQGVLPTKVKIRPTSDVNLNESNSGIDSTTVSRSDTVSRRYGSSSQLLQRRKSNNGVGNRGSPARVPLGDPP